MSDKILLIDKSVGWTSFDVVAKVRGMLKQAYLDKEIVPTKRQLKVGHAGTLDPFATGLLVVLLGDATKRSDEFLKLDKIYEATITLGKISSTGDPEGELTSVSSVVPTESTIRDVLKRYVGQIQQRPPIHSAIKVNGQRAYKLARKGQDVTIPLRTVTIYSIELVDYNYPELTIRTHVSSGTYIRSLAQDIGESLGVGAYCSQLRRTKIAEWDISDAIVIEQVSVDLI